MKEKVKSIGFDPEIFNTGSVSGLMIVLALDAVSKEQINTIFSVSFYKTVVLSQYYL